MTECRECSNHHHELRFASYAELDHRGSKQRRHARRTDTEPVPNQLAAFPLRSEVSDLAFASAHARAVLIPSRRSSRDDDPTPVRVEPVDQHPSTCEKTLPEAKGLLGVEVWKEVSGPVSSDRGLPPELRVRFRASGRRGRLDETKPPLGLFPFDARNVGRGHAPSTLQRACQPKSVMISIAGLFGAPKMTTVVITR